MAFLFFYLSTFTETIIHSEEKGSQELAFVDLDSNKTALTALEAHNKLSDLDKRDLEFNSDEEYLRNSIEGRINYLVGNFSKEYFDNYKGKRFKVTYRMHEGTDLYSLICFASNGYWGFETEHFDEQYKNFKDKIDEGTIK